MAGMKCLVSVHVLPDQMDSICCYAFLFFKISAGLVVTVWHLLCSTASYHH